MRDYLNKHLLVKKFQGIQSFTQKYEKELAQVDDWLQFLKP